MTVNDLVGHYDVIGTNQDDSGNTYKGKLVLSTNTTNRFSAKWLINNEQEQFGEGYLESNLLTINFYYYGDNDTIFKGKVIYKVITKDILEGKWFEEFGNPMFFGTENCFRAKSNKLVVN